MIEICPYEECTGCMACSVSCPRNAIGEQFDDLGFRNPVINQDKCIDCGLCVKVCPSNKHPETYDVLNTYASAVNDQELLESCASGGLATIFAEQILSEGGIVYGCSGENIWDVKYIRITERSQLSIIRGSKYVQGRISHIYPLIKQDLAAGKKVVVIGISCQLAGLKNYLRRSYENLLVISIICHGGASQQMLSQNADYYRKKLSVPQIWNVAFRRKLTKSDSVHQIRYGFYFDAVQERFSYVGIQDMFTLGYASNLLFRDSCYNCKYASTNRVSDITIGDFWKLPEDSCLRDSNGVSVVLTHTIKGENLLESIAHRVTIEKRNLDEAITGNPQLQHPTSKGNGIELFRAKYAKSGLIKAIKTVNRKLLLKYKIVSIINRTPIIKTLYSTLRTSATRR